MRQARSEPVSVRDPWPVTRLAASRMRAVSEVNGTITPPNGSAATIVRSAGVSSASSPSIAAPEELFAAGDERLLIDDEDEAAAGGDVVVRAVRWWQRAALPSRRRRRGGDAPQRAHRSHPIGDADFDVRRLEIRDGCAVGLDGDEIDGGSGRALAGDLGLVCREERCRTRGGCRESRKREEQGETGRGHLSLSSSLFQLEAAGRQLPARMTLLGADGWKRTTS